MSPISKVVDIIPPSHTAASVSDSEVLVQIKWPSGNTKKRVLPKELCTLGKMLCRGTYKQIARAAWKCKELQKDFLVLIGKQVHKECSDMCRKIAKNEKKKIQHVSCLGRTDKADILQFSFEKVNEELKEKAPLFQLVLQAASLRAEDKSPKRSLQAVCVATAVCLKNRSKNMVAFQLILANINNMSGFMVSIYSCH